MSFVSDTLTTKARKRYRCYYCNQRIDIGESHLKRSGAESGDFWTMRMHPECAHQAEDIEKWDQDNYDFHEPGDFKRPMHAFDPVI